MRRIKRILGRILYSTIGRLLPAAHCRIKPLGRLGKWFRGSICGRLMLSSCGKNVNIYKNSELSQYIELGDNSDLGLRARIYGKVIIGNDVIMAPDVVIYTINHKTTDLSIPIKYQGYTKERPVTIGDGVWIGHGAFILPGVNIGKGAVVAARTVVTKDVPDYSIVAGNPGRIVKTRTANVGEEHNE